MNKELFVQNVERFCKLKGVTRTVACRESGAGERLIENTKRGSEPSVGKVQLLAQYLGVTVSELLGEAPPGNVSDLDTADRELLAAYHRASTDDQQAISLILNKYREKETASYAG